MNKSKLSFFIVSIVLLAAMTACASLPSLSLNGLNSAIASAKSNATVQRTGFQSSPAQQAPTATPFPTQPAPVTNSGTAQGLLDAYQGVMENVYAAVSPSVVNIHVVEGASAASPSQQFPFPFGGNPGQGQGGGEALGSGFVWDTQGHIVTNNHVVSGATEVDVTFSDGTNVPATIVGTDPSSDLAVIKVDVPASQLKPVSMGNSVDVKVGQVAIAIGNPFGLQGTMTVGIISAKGRQISATDGSSSNGAGYEIPDILQTDAPINPGNSGGVLVNDQGQVIGVTAAIESSTNSNSGIGFAIPAQTVQKVIPTLIQTGKFEHPYLGISGTNLTSDVAQAMNLPANTRGALVEEVVQGGPAAQGGLQGSSSTTTINGQDIPVGGDVITAINGQTIKSMDDLITYLSSSTSVGDKVSITYLRGGQEHTTSVTLKARPATTPQSSLGLGQGQGQGQGQVQPSGRVYLGIQGVDLVPALDQALNIPTDQQGILIETVQPGSPAEKAGLKGSSTPVTVNGQTLNAGGDIITAVDGQPVTQTSDLSGMLSQYSAGQKVQLTILRDGNSMDVTVTLAARPATAP